MSRRPSRRMPPAIKDAYAQVCRRLRPNSTSRPKYPDWNELSPGTTFAWVHPDLEATARWCWLEVKRQIENQSFYEPKGRRRKRTIVLDAIKKGMGVMPSDVLAQNRNMALAIARHVAVVCMIKAGINKTAAGVALHRDGATIRTSYSKFKYLAKEWPDVDNFMHERPAPDIIADRSVPS